MQTAQLTEISTAENIRKLVSGVHDVRVHGTRFAPPRTGAPVRAAPQCSAALLSLKNLNVLNEF